MVIETWFSQDVKKPVQVHYIDGNVFSQDNSGNLIGVLLMDGENEVTVSGTVSANVIRSDGETVAVSGTKSGNKAQVILPQSAYAVPGLISVIIKTTDSGAVTTLCAVVGNVYQSTTDTVVDPGTIIPSVQSLIDAIDAAVASIPADYSDLWASLAPEYDPNSTYGRGAIVRYNQHIYRNTTEITTPESWTSGHWTQDTLGGAMWSICFKYVNVLTESADCDNITQTGYYYWAGSHSPVHAPSAHAYSMLVFRRTATSIVQFAIPWNTAARIAVRFLSSSSWYGWYQYPDFDDLNAAITGVDNHIAEIESNVYYPYTDFVNGNINSSGQSTNANMHPLRSDYIPLDEFVSVDVTGDDGNGNNYTYQLFAYDGNYGYLGFGGSTYHDQVTTRQDVLTAYPTAKFVRIKVTGGDSGTNLDVDDLDDYGYKGLVRISYDKVNAASSGNIDLMSMIESKADENGKYSESFTLEFNMPNYPTIVSIFAQYTGSTPPTIQFSNRNHNNITSLSSPAYTLGDTVEMKRKSWRIPPSSTIYNKERIVVTIPSGTVVDIHDACLRQDQRNRFGSDGIKWHGHAGYIAPSNSSTAFQYAAELGYDSLITIPKFTSDGVGICFHDDSSISGDLYWMDGTAITGSDNTAISNYTYDYITTNFRMKSLSWGVLHVPTIDEYFRICSMCGMKPIFSVHSTPAGMFTGATGQANFQKIKDLAVKWNILGRISIKTGASSILSAARAIFGTDIDSYIIINGQTHAPTDQLTICKDAGLVDQSATDLTGCPYRIVSEYFYAQTVSGATYYTQTMAMISTAMGQGFPISVACTGANPSGAELTRLIGIGVKEFTVDNHISMGLDW